MLVFVFLFSSLNVHYLCLGCVPLGCLWGVCLSKKIIKLKKTVCPVPPFQLLTVGE